MSVRRPAAAGTFYSSGALELKAQVESCFLGPGGPGGLPILGPGPGRIIGLVSPHAGFVYSGSAAANAYYRLAEDGLPDVAVLLGPNHRAHHPPVAVSNEDAWRTPFGDIPVDKELAAEIASGYPEASTDPGVHIGEHSLEVQLPFLQYVYGSVKPVSIVPILIGASGWSREEGVVEFARGVGHAVGKALEGREAVIIASTDFTHYESFASAQAKDSRAISAILELDEEALLGTVASMNISMCGVLPTAITIAACKELGAISAKELAYRNSGDVTGDYTEVVGYAALEIDK